MEENMTSLLDQIKKSLEDSYDIVRDGASTVIDRAEDFGKLSKLKFDIRQLNTRVEKKLTILGDAVFPHLVKNDVEMLKDNPAIKLVVEEIQDLNLKTTEKQKEIDKVVNESEKMNKVKDEEKLQTQIADLEREVEEKMNVLKKLKNTKD
jgi:hypothetical protein